MKEFATLIAMLNPLVSDNIIVIDAIDYTSGDDWSVYINNDEKEIEISLYKTRIHIKSSDYQGTFQRHIAFSTVLMKIFQVLNQN